jgi:hypothetical protein
MTSHVVVNYFAVWAVINQLCACCIQTDACLNGWAIKGTSSSIRERAKRDAPTNKRDLIIKDFLENDALDVHRVAKALYL